MCIDYMYVVEGMEGSRPSRRFAVRRNGDMTGKKGGSECRDRLWWAAQASASSGRNWRALLAGVRAYIGRSVAPGRQMSVWYAYNERLLLSALALVWYSYVIPHRGESGFAFAYV